MADAWFYSLNNERKGPVDLATLKLLISTGAVSGASLVWKKGMASWVVAETIDSLVANTPPPIPQTQSKAIAVTPRPQVLTRAPDEAPKRPDSLFAVILLSVSSGILAVDALFILMQAQIAGLLGLIGVGGFIAAIVFSAIFIYRAWRCVPEDCRSTTPEKAVGFLFIPFFNFYWFFIGIRGLSADTERALKSRGLDAKAPVTLSLRERLTEFVAQAKGLTVNAPVMLGLITAILLVATAVFCWVPFMCHIVFGACVVVSGLWMIQQARATACLIGTPDPTPSPKPLLKGLFISAGICVLLSLMMDMSSQKSSGSSVGNYIYNSEQERQSEYLQNTRRAWSNEKIKWAGPAESATEEKERRDLEALARKNRALSDDLKSVRDSWAPAR